MFTLFQSFIVINAAIVEVWSKAISHLTGKIITRSVIAGSFVIWINKLNHLCNVYIGLLHITMPHLGEWRQRMGCRGEGGWGPCRLKQNSSSDLQT